MPEARDLPLLRWGEELRRAAAKRRRRRYGLAIGAARIAALAATILWPPAPRLVWNASASAPIGLYRVSSGAALRRGDMAVAWTPDPYRGLAAERHYLPANVPLVKAVAAVPGDRICAVGESLFVNGHWTARRLAADGAGRPMPMWTGCETLAADRYLLLMTGAPASFDGRYFGPVDATEIVGKAVPLWVG